MSRCLGVIAFLLLFSHAFAAETETHWFQTKTDHFVVLTDAGEKQARHVAGQLERMNAVFAKLLPQSAPDPGGKIVVLALRNRKDFQSVEPPAYLSKGALDLAGLFLGREDRSYILLRLDTDGEHPYQTVYHEYAHYMNRHAAFMPVWLNEGLAQFFQYTDILERQVRLGQPSANEIFYLRQQKLLPLSTLFAVDHNSPYYHEQDKGSIFYAESWALTHLLSVRDFEQRTTKLRSYLQAIAAGQDPVAAGEHIFGDLRALQRDLEEYVNQGSFKLFTLPLQAAVDESAFAVDPVATPDADAVRADVLVETGRSQEAEVLLHEVLKQAPESAQAHESMAVVKLREHDSESARKWYGEAAALGSTSFLTYYYYGVLSLQHDSEADKKKIGDSLRRAVELNPKFAPAYAALAHFDIVDGNLDEAVAMSVKAVQLNPENVQYRLNAAEVRIQRHEISQAISILQAAERVADTPDNKSLVRTRLDRVLAYKAEVDQIEARRSGSHAEPDTIRETLPDPALGRNKVTDSSGRALELAKLLPEHRFPEGTPSGPRRVVQGILHNVGCFYPKGMAFTVTGQNAPLILYSSDMYAIAYTAGNFTPAKELDPCTELEGMRAKVTYAATETKEAAGQVLAMELNR